MSLGATVPDAAAFFHVMRFATNPDGSPSFSEERVSVGAEILANSDYRASLTIDE